MVPGNLGCGKSVFAKTAILAHDEASFFAIPSPIPLEAPVITTFLSLKSSIYTLKNNSLFKIRLFVY